MKKVLVVLWMVAAWAGAGSQTPGVYDPVANPKAVVSFGHARFTVLTAQMIRMEWAADDHFEDRPSFAFLDRNLEVPAFTTTRDGGRLVIETSALKLTYSPKPDDESFSPGNLAIALSVDGQSVVWHPGLKDDGNLMGTIHSLDRAVGSKTVEPMQPGLLSRNGWAVVDDSTTPLYTSDDFSFMAGEKSVWPWVALRAAGKRQDLYFFGYGHDYKGAMADFTKVSGKIPLPPRYIFGAWWTRYWSYTDQDLLGLVQTYRENDIPLDVMVIDMDWHQNARQLNALRSTYPAGFATSQTKHGRVGDNFDASGARLGWTGYTWNSDEFPYPAEFLGKLHDDGVKVTLNLHPGSGVMPWEKAYPAMARAMGIDPATQQYVKFEMLDQKYAQNYFDLLHHPLEKEGVDFWWLDWQPANEVVQTPGVDSTFWLNYLHFTDQEREGKRPMLFGRWGGLGNHRYQTGFSGDVVIGWDSLAFQPYFTATAANVGYAYISHDIGGHIPGPTEPELYTRWVQWGAYSPILRTHSAINPWGERRLWAYPEPYADIMKQQFRDRYAMIPYLYTESRRTYDTGVAFLHPLYYDWPEAAEAYDRRNEYVFGEQMIVAPVTAAMDPGTQLATATTWVPPGDWFEPDQGLHVTGPRTVTARYSLKEVPRYLKGGAIVPLAPPMNYSDEKPVDPLVLNISPLRDGQQTSYTMYDDGGKAEEYKRGADSWTELSATQHGAELTVHVAAIEGSYDGMPEQRGYEIQLPGDWPPQTVTANGQVLTQQSKDHVAGWTYDGYKLMTTITVPRMSVHKALKVTVVVAPALASSRCKLNGLPGVMARLHQAQLTMTDEFPVAFAPDVLLAAMATGDRLSYHPETAAMEVDTLLGEFGAILPAVEAGEKGSEAKFANAVSKIVPDQKSAEFADHLATYQRRATSAIALVEDAAGMLSSCQVR
jgi:alpha-glucosidase (family GH31 glycosyl hydrolase)